jgi:hypothetical protein
MSERHVDGRVRLTSGRVQHGFPIAERRLQCIAPEDLVQFVWKASGQRHLSRESAMEAPTDTWNTTDLQTRPLNHPGPENGGRAPADRTSSESPFSPLARGSRRGLLPVP